MVATHSAMISFSERRWTFHWGEDTNRKCLELSIKHSFRPKSLRLKRCRSWELGQTRGEILTSSPQTFGSRCTIKLFISTVWPFEIAYVPFFNVVSSNDVTARIGAEGANRKVSRITAIDIWCRNVNEHGPNVFRTCAYLSSREACVRRRLSWVCPRSWCLFHRVTSAL